MRFAHRHRLYCLSAAVAVLAMAAPGAMAQPTEIYRGGLWSAYSGSGDDQRPLCGIATTGGEGRRVAVQQYGGETGLELQLSKDSWAIPDNTTVELQFQFDGREPTTEQAVGAGHTLIVRLPMERSVLFMRALRHARVMRVLFPTGNEQPWTGGLSGSANAITAFNNCRASLAPQEPTQPFRPAAPPAPSNSAPTQPFIAPTPTPTPTPAPAPPQRS